jgi:hypothetical protein
VIREGSRIPADCLLADEEIAALLSSANARKASGEPGFTIDADPPDWYVVRVPVGAAITKDEVIIALTQLNNAKVHRDADVLFAFSGGGLVKRGWTTLKGSPSKTLMVGGRPMRVDW